MTHNRGGALRRRLFSSAAPALETRHLSLPTTRRLATPFLLGNDATAP